MPEPGEAEFRGLRAAEAQAWLASIVQSSHDAIVGKSLDGLITSWNPGAEQLYGYTAEEMIGRSLDVVIPSDSRAEEAAMLVLALTDAMTCNSVFNCSSASLQHRRADNAHTSGNV